MTARKGKAATARVRDVVAVEIVDRVNRANQIVNSTRAALCEMRGGADFGPMVRAALDMAALELEEAKVLLGECGAA